MIAARELLLVTFLAVLAIASWWVAEQYEYTQWPAEEPRHEPDYFIEDFTMTVMDEEGKPSRQLVADSLVHYMDDDTSELTEPRLTLFDEDQPPWLIESERGWISGDGELVLLQGQVEIDRPGSQTNRPIHISTRNLRVEPERDYVETDEYVLITSRRDRTESQGMRAFLQPRLKLTLISEVKSLFYNE